MFNGIPSGTQIWAGKSLTYIRENHESDWTVFQQAMSMFDELPEGMGGYHLAYPSFWGGDQSLSLFMMSRAGGHSSGRTKKIRIGSAWKHRAAFATVASCSCKMRLFNGILSPRLLVRFLSILKLGSKLKVLGSHGLTEGELGDKTKSSSSLRRGAPPTFQTSSTEKHPML